MTILVDFLRAAGQMGDPRFRGVLWRGIGLTLALLVAVYLVFFQLVRWLVPDRLTLPLIGPVGWIDDAASGASVLVLLVASVFLMVPVAALFTSFFLDDVADAVEARYYPRLAPAPRLGLGDTVRDALAFLGLLVAGNLVAVAAYLAVPPAAPLIFLSLNGYLLGREYFHMVAVRRWGRDGARRLAHRYAVRLWVAGVLMALPLTVPILNLLVPVLGAATFTHLYHRLPPPPEGFPARTSPDRRR